MKHRKHIATSLALALIFSVLYTATRTHPEAQREPSKHKRTEKPARRRGMKTRTP